MEKEIRNLGNIEIRASESGDSRKVEGYAVVFDSQSEFLGFYETIERGAITQELVDRCDIFATFNHDMNKVFARSNKGEGSLTLTVDERGLKFSFDVPNTSLGDELLEYLKRGDISKCSFAFCIDPSDDESEEWEERDGVYFRKIKKIAELFDIAICWVPAYSDTEVSKRTKEKIDELENERIAKINASLDNMMNEIEELAKI